MTKDEIRALIAAKITGQGNQVDIGNALPTVFDSILELISGGGGGGGDAYTKAETDALLALKQNLLTAGVGIVIDDTTGVISVDLDTDLTVVLTALPPATEANYDLYKGKLVLVIDPDSTEQGNAYIEYIIVQMGATTYKWEEIGKFHLDAPDKSYIYATAPLTPFEQLKAAVADDRLLWYRATTGALAKPMLFSSFNESGKLFSFAVAKDLATLQLVEVDYNPATPTVNVTELDLSPELPDWNENDPTARGYIANRTHWTEKKGDMFYKGRLAETDNTGVNLVDALVAGKKYNVKIGGASFTNIECTETVTATRITRTLQNAFTLSAYKDFTDPANPQYGVSFLYEGSPSTLFYDVEISANEDIVHKIDPKYLPDATKVFEDVETLPTTDISKEVIYRVPEYEYVHDGQKYASVTGYKSTDTELTIGDISVTVYNGGNVIIYYWNQITDALVNYWGVQGWLVPVTDFSEAEMFKLAEDNFAYKSTVQRVAETYKLYHNPTQTAGEYLLINETGDTDVFEDVTALPSSGISSKIIYRIRRYDYEYQNNPIPQPKCYITVPGSGLSAGAYGMYDSRTSSTTIWSAVTSAMVQGWITDGRVAEEPDFARCSFCRVEVSSGTFEYCAFSSVRRTATEGYDLYHNPTETASGYLLIGGGEVPEAVQSDWNQNDSTADDYIKNRTHWTEKAGDTVVGVSMLAGEGNNLGLYFGEQLVAGKKYNITVERNGVVKTFLDVVCEEVVDATSVVKQFVVTPITPNGLLLETIYDTSGGSDEYDSHISCNNWSDTEEVQVTIRAAEEVVHKLDIKYQSNVQNVSELPTAGIDKDIIYRVSEYAYKRDGQPIPKPTFYRTKDSFRATPEGIYDDADFSGAPMCYPWNQIDSVWMQDYDYGWEEVTDFANANFFGFADGTYGYKDTVSRQLRYGLYHNPTATAGAYILINEDSGVDIFIDVFGELPSAGISTDRIYRLTKYVYAHNGVQMALSTSFTGFKSLSPAVQVRSNGLTVDRVNYGWDDVTMSLIDTLFLTEQRIAICPFEEAEFGYDGTPGTPLYDNISNFARSTEVELYHNPTGVAGGYILIGGGGSSVETDGVTTENNAQGKLQANAVIPVAALPTTDIKEKSLYLLTENVSGSVYKYYHNTSELLPDEPTWYYAPNPVNPQISSTGIRVGGVTTAWADIDDAYVNDLVSQNLLALTNYSMMDFGKYGENKYDYGGRFRMETEAVSFSMVKLFHRKDNAWESVSTIRLTADQYSLLTSAQKNDGSTYIVDNMPMPEPTFDYTTLANRPTINGVLVNGNLSLADLSLYSKSEANALLAAKQDKLTAGTGISIDANNVISASGGGGWTEITNIDTDTVISNSWNELMVVCQLQPTGWTGGAMYLSRTICKEVFQYGTYCADMTFLWKPNPSASDVSMAGRYIRLTWNESTRTLTIAGSTIVNLNAPAAPKYFIR